MGASSQSSVEGEYDVGTAIDLPPQQQQQVNPNNNTNICVFSLSLPTCLSFFRRPAVTESCQSWRVRACVMRWSSNVSCHACVRPLILSVIQFIVPPASVGEAIF